MNFVRRTYPEMAAGGFSRIDGTIQFFTRVNSLLDKEMTVVDFGAGRGEWFHDDHLPYRKAIRNLRGRVKEVIGVDVDRAVFDNPSLDRALLMDGESIPLADGSAGLIIADHVFEHIDNPSMTAWRLTKLLAPGGWLCVRTPNRYGYVATINRLLPPSMRSRVLHVAQPNRKDEDVFEAHYLLNTTSALKKYFSACDVHAYPWEAEPAYYMGRASVFRAMRVVGAITPGLFSNVIFAFIQKRT